MLHKYIIIHVKSLTIIKAIMLCNTTNEVSKMNSTSLTKSLHKPHWMKGT